MNSVHEKPGVEKFFGGAFPKDKDACVFFLNMMSLLSKSMNFCSYVSLWHEGNIRSCLREENRKQRIKIDDKENGRAIQIEVFLHKKEEKYLFRCFSSQGGDIFREKRNRCRSTKVRCFDS